MRRRHGLLRRPHLPRATHKKEWRRMRTLVFVPRRQDKHTSYHIEETRVLSHDVDASQCVEIDRALPTWTVGDERGDESACTVVE